MSELLPEDPFEGEDVEELVSSELSLAPGLRNLLQDEANQIVKDCKEFAPLYVDKDENIPFVRIPIKSEIVKDAPSCGLEIILQIMLYSSDGELSITYLRQQESYDTEDDSPFIVTEPSLRFELGNDLLSVPLEVNDIELYKNSRVKELLAPELNNDLALEIYSDLRNIHNIVKPEVDPEVDSIAQIAVESAMQQAA